MEKELIENKIEMRRLSEDVSTGKIKSEDAKKRLEELRAKKTEIEKRIALAKAPVDKGGGGTSNSFSEIRKAMQEKRAITLNGTGAIVQINELIKAMCKKKPLLEMVRKFTGPNASTNIPLFMPITPPVAYAEGAASIAVDATAGLSNRSLTPRAFWSLLPVSAETISLGSINIESELPTIFAEAFAGLIHSQILQGTGTGLNFRRIFPVAKSNATFIEKDASIFALRELALMLQDYDDEGIIIMHPSVYSTIMSDTNTHEEQIYKEELISVCL
jgi:HK97 family phage major capsid protein